MTRTLRRWAFAPLWAIVLAATAVPAAGQISLDGLIGSPPAAEESTAPAADAPAEDATDPDPDAAAAALADAQQALATAVPDLDGWASRVQAAEQLLQSGTGSPLALTRTRQMLFGWRDRFQALGSINAGRIATVTGQIAALGTPAEGSSDQPAVAARRAELEAQLNVLAAPAVLAREAYARADGLISEVDSQLRARETARLTARGPSPLNPADWPMALDTAVGAAVGLGTAAVARFNASIASGAIATLLPLSLLYLAAAAILLFRSRAWIGTLQTRVERQQARAGAVFSFLLSLWQIALPTLGLAALILGLRQIGVLGRTDENLTRAIFGAGTIIILAHWLNGQLFPRGVAGGPLAYPRTIRAQIRTYGVALGTGLAAMTIVTAVMNSVGASSASTNVVILPIQIILALILYRLGYLLRHAPMEKDGVDRSSGRVRTTVGLLCLIVAVATPVLSAAGFAAASDALFTPAVMTLAIFGIIIVLQKLVYDIYKPADTTESMGPLMPVLIGFVLFVLAVPVLALVWGARVTDLLEVWAQFRAGFQFGATTISPTDFMTFVLLFAGGYLLTQFVKRSLKVSVLPRTKLDLGGQNAVVAGVGYIGIFLAALIAITTAGIDLSSLAIVAGALSVGIGFGLQTIVQNFVSGIILLIERPIGEGDMIEVNGQMGFVRDISVRSTRIETFDRTDVIIPNADLVAGQVTNWTRGNLVGRLILPVGVAYGSDIEAVRKALLEVARNQPMVIAEPAPQALFMSFGDSSLNFELRVILRDVNWKIVVTDEMNRDILRRFASAGISIPFPQTDIWLRNPESLQPKPHAPATGLSASPSDQQVPPSRRKARTADDARAMLSPDDLSDTATTADPSDAGPEGDTT